MGELCLCGNLNNYLDVYVSGKSTTKQVRVHKAEQDDLRSLNLHTERDVLPPPTLETPTFGKSIFSLVSKFVKENAFSTNGLI